MTGQKYFKLLTKFLQKDLPFTKHVISNSVFKATFISMNIAEPNLLKCRAVSATEGKIKVELEIQDHMCNMYGTLHGGCSATLVDAMTTVALMATPRGAPGVSVDLHMTYLSAAKKGETIIIDAEVIRQGKTLAFTRADLMRKTDRVLIATGLHTKAFPSQAVPEIHVEC